jgi:hypothetical protein
LSAPEGVCFLGTDAGTHAMRALLILAAVWPGLLQAWLLGRWRGLSLAVAFAAALNLALITTFVWPEWPLRSLPDLAATTAWVLVLGLWIIGFRGVRSDWRLICPPQAAPATPEQSEWFRDAQIYYLKGHWIEAEAVITRLLNRQPADVEAKLLLASIQRRTERLTPARQTLIELTEQPAACRWHYEITAELKQLSERESNAAESLTQTAETQLPTIEQPRKAA